MNLRNLSLFIIITFLVVCSFSYEDSSGQVFIQNEHNIQQIDDQISLLNRMNFLNQNLANKPLIVGQNSKQELFEEVKIRKFTSIKLDVSQQLRNIKNTNNQAQQTSKSDHKQLLLDNLEIISTFSIAAKRLQGLNFYNHVLLKLMNNFYSIEGDRVFSLPQYQWNSDQVGNNVKSINNLPLLISSVRNENFYIGQYTKGEYKQNCLSLKINQVEMRKKELQINNQPEFMNLIIQNIGCHNNSLPQQQQQQQAIYNHMFTFSSYQSKRVYYILSDDLQIHFYFYSEKTQSLLIDQNKTITIRELTSGLLLQKGERIQKVVKMNTYLLIVTNKNNLFSINLLLFLNLKKRQYLNLYESVPLQFQKVIDIKFNDYDYRYFFVLTSNNIYQYQVTGTKIIKKFPLKEELCLFDNINNGQGKCIENVEVLEKYFLVQYRMFGCEQSNRKNFDYDLIDRQSGSTRQFGIPFSHEKKCSKYKKFILSKNKNSHYTITLACFIEDTSDRNASNKENQSQASNYLIMQHLNIQTSNELVPSGDLGGIDFSRFRLPMIVFSIGLICYITIKRNSKKSPQKQIEEQKLSRKFEEEIMQTIKREKDRQQALQSIKRKDY